MLWEGAACGSEGDWLPGAQREAAEEGPPCLGGAARNVSHVPRSTARSGRRVSAGVTAANDMNGFVSLKKVLCCRVLPV